MRIICAYKQTVYGSDAYLKAEHVHRKNLARPGKRFDRVDPIQNCVSRHGLLNHTGD